MGVAVLLTGTSAIGTFGPPPATGPFVGRTRMLVGEPGVAVARTGPTLGPTDMSVATAVFNKLANGCTSSTGGPACASGVDGNSGGITNGSFNSPSPTASWAGVVVGVKGVSPTSWRLRGLKTDTRLTTTSTTMLQIMIIAPSRGKDKERTSMLPHRAAAVE